MSVRLYSEFSSSEGNIYKIEIHDSSWGAAPSSEFKVDGSGFQLTYDGETDDIISPIVSSKLTFGAYSENATFETFINTLKTFQENRFRIAVYRKGSAISVADFEERVKSDGGTVEGRGCLLDAVDALGGPDGYSLYWAGWITQDLVQVEDVSQPYIFQITAADGLGKLANIDYNVANDITQGEGLQLTRLTQMMLNALKLAGLYDLWDSGATFLETSADWWETTAHVYSTSTDPLHLTAVDTRLLQSYDSDGNLVYNNALEALRQVTTLFAGRIYLSNGRWIFEQYGQRASASRYVSRYTYGGTAISRTLVSDDVVLDQTTYAARRSGNSWDFLPAMRKAQVSYVQKFLNPFGFAGFRFFGGNLNGGFGGQFTAGFIAGGSGIQLGFGTALFRMQVSGTIDVNPVVPIFRVRIRIKDVSTGTYYYYRRDFVSTNGQAMFGTPQWTTTSSWYYFDLKSFFILAPVSSVNDVVQIWTDDLPVSGDLDFRLEFYDIIKMSSSLPYSFGSVYFDAFMLFSTSTQGENAPAGEIFTSVNNEAGIDSQLTLDLGDVFFAEGPLQTGHLAVFNGTSWVASSLWRKGSSGTGLRILKLLTSEALALHVRPIERYNGELIGSYGFSPRLQFESTAYLQTGGTFNARMDEWSGEMYAIQRIRTSVTELDEIVDISERTPLVGQSTTSGTSPNDLDTGRVAGMVIDKAQQALGPFQKVATGGKVLGTLDVEQDLTVEQNLQVDGDTTIVGTIDVTDLDVSNDLTVDGSTTIGTLSAGSSTLSSATITTTLGVTGASTLGTLSAGASTLSSASVTGNQTVGGTLGVTGASTLGTLSAGASTLASSSVTGNQTVGGTLGVTGTTTLGTLAAGASTLNSATVTTTLGVTGATTLGTLNAGTTTVGDLTADATTLDSATISGTLGVTGASTLGTLSAGASTLNSATVTTTLGVSGATTLGALSAGTTTVGDLTADATTLDSATISGTLGVTGASTLGILSAGASTLSSAAVTGNQTVGGTLGVTGTTTLGTLSAGASTLSSAAVTGNQTVGGTLGVTGTSTLGTLSAGASTLNSATVTTTLGVTGASTLGTLSAGASTLNSATVTTTLGVSGATTLGTLSAGASTLSSAAVTGNQTIGGTLDVDGRTATSYVQLDTTFEPNGEPAGAFYWDQDGGVAAVRGIDGVSLDLNEKSIWYAKNQTGSTIAKGSAVYAVGTLGSSGQVLIAKMIADGTINAKYFLGITQADIDNDGDGYVVSRGKIKGINTTAWNDGDVLYVDENVAGALSDTEPEAPNLKLPVAFVIKSASNGTIAVRQTAGTYLAESHDVQIDSPATNEVLARSSAGRWENTPVDALFTETDTTPVETDQSSFSKVYGGSGTMLGEPDSWMPITINSVNYLIPLYLAP